MIVRYEPAKAFQIHPAGRASAMLLMAAFSWGSGNVANKTVLQDLDPFTVVVLRHLVAAMAIVPMLRPDLAQRMKPGQSVPREQSQPLSNPQ